MPSRQARPRGVADQAMEGWLGSVTDGLALLAAWAGFLLLLGLLVFVVLRGDSGGPG